MTRALSPRVTVITASFNSRSTILDTIRSVREQDLGDVEHVVVDGGSSDGTQALITQSSPTVRLLSEPDRGIYHAMNKGVRLATAPIVGFLNSDDMFAHPRVLSRIVRSIDAGSDACFGDLIYVERDRPNQAVRYWRSGRFTPGKVRLGWAPPHPTFYARREVLVRSGGFDESFGLASDFELMARLLLTERIHADYLPEVLVHMRLGGQTNLNVRNIWRQNRQIRRALAKHCPGTFLPAWAVGKFLIRARQYLTRGQSLLVEKASR
jgi:glycosyltransferase involved in cell wall biosynthesis